MLTIAKGPALLCKKRISHWNLIVLLECKRTKRNDPSLGWILSKGKFAELNRSLNSICRTESLFISNCWLLCLQLGWKHKRFIIMLSRYYIHETKSKLSH